MYFTSSNYNSSYQTVASSVVEAAITSTGSLIRLQYVVVPNPGESYKNPVGGTGIIAYIMWIDTSRTQYYNGTTVDSKIRVVRCWLIR